MKTFFIIIGLICLYYAFQWVQEPSAGVDRTIKTIVDDVHHGDFS